MKINLIVLILFCLSIVGCSGSNNNRHATNFVLINRLPSTLGEPHDIVGIYMIEHLHGVKLRGNPDINWGKNLILHPVPYGGYTQIAVGHSTTGKYDLRVDFSGQDPQGREMQYFDWDTGAGPGEIMHLSIRSVADHTAKWARPKGTNPNFDADIIK